MRFVAIGMAAIAMAGVSGAQPDTPSIRFEADNDLEDAIDDLDGQSKG